MANDANAPSALPDDSSSDSPNGESASSQKYFPAPGEAQLTARAILAGCLVGSVVSCTNVYIGLKIGWTFGASIIAAVLGYSVFMVLGNRLSVLETNIAQTSGSAAGYMSSAAGLVAAIPALELLDYHIPWYYLTLWALAVAFLGVFYAVPLRRQMIEVDQLRFPTGTATAETILAMVSEAGEALAKARVLIYSAIAAALFSLACYFIVPLESPPIHEWFGISALTVAANWTFRLNFVPSLFGAGFLIGPRVVLSLMLGAIVGWGVLGPIAQAQGWAPGEVESIANGPRGWILWPGVALMVSEALMALALSWKTFLRAFRFSSPTDLASEEREKEIPNAWWIGGLIAGSALTTIIAYFAFGIPWYLTLVAIALSSVLAIVAARSLGETDINPVGGMGKVTQLVFGGLAPGQMTTNVLAAAITGGGASQAADMMQDLKTGNLLGAAPRKQFIAQLFGIVAGVIFAVPVYKLFTSQYEIGGKDLPAPAAFAWKAMAEVVTEGFDALPPHAPAAVAIACVFGMLLPLLRRIDAIKPYVPSGMAVGIAFIIHAYFSIVMFLGLVAWWIWKRIDPIAVEKYNFAVASGLIAGEGLMGIVKAFMTMAGVKPWIEG